LYSLTYGNYKHLNFESETFGRPRLRRVGNGKTIYNNEHIKGCKMDSNEGMVPMVCFNNDYDMPSGSIRTAEF
jgi:hypothetical protein